MAATSAISRRMRSIAGSRNSNVNMWSDGAPTRVRIPIQALARRGGTTKTASTDRTARTRATGRPTKIESGAPMYGHDGSPDRLGLREPVEPRGSPTDRQRDQREQREGHETDRRRRRPPPQDVDPGVDLRDLERTDERGEEPIDRRRSLAVRRVELPPVAIHQDRRTPRTAGSGCSRPPGPRGRAARAGPRRRRSPRTPDAEPTRTRPRSAGSTRRRTRAFVAGGSAAR